MLSKEEAWRNPSALLQAVWWGAGMGTRSIRCLGCPLLVRPGSILISAATCSLRAWPGVPAGWLELAGGDAGVTRAGSPRAGGC